MSENAPFWLTSVYAAPTAPPYECVVKDAAGDCVAVVRGSSQDEAETRGKAVLAALIGGAQKVSDKPITTKVEGFSIQCAMSGDREILNVHRVGSGGVTFMHGDDASVIVDGENLIKLRQLIDRAIMETPYAE